MRKYREITQARKLLELPVRATMADIKTHYRRLMIQWHPDTCKEGEEKCREMAAKVSAAYSTIVEYCDHYKFSFSKEDVKEHLCEQEWMSERFGNDPVWGSGVR
jgi:DnaJ-class molecular chaperone